MPQTPRYERHRRRIFIFVIVAYLLYTLYETFHQVQLAGDYYKVLSVSPFSDERAIKSRFRRLAAQHHPDKSGMDSGSDAYFMFLRRAQETLVDPMKRFAYDRFGPDMHNWGDQKTMRDFVMHSLLKSVLPQYVGGFVTMLVLNWLWWPNWGRYVCKPGTNTLDGYDFLTVFLVAFLHLCRITHPRTYHDHSTPGRLHANNLPPRCNSILPPR